RVALSLLGDKTNAQRLREYVVVYGNAPVTEGGAVPLLQRLAPVYLGPNADYPTASMRSIAGYVTRIMLSQDSVRGFNRPVIKSEPERCGHYRSQGGWARGVMLPTPLYSSPRTRAPGILSPEPKCR